MTVCLNINGLRTSELIQEFRIMKSDKERDLLDTREHLLNITFLSFARSFCVVWMKASQRWCRMLSVRVAAANTIPRQSTARGMKSLLEIIRTNHSLTLSFNAYGTVCHSHFVTEFFDTILLVRSWYDVGIISHESTPMSNYLHNK